jgi:hypothetical protein
MSSAETFKRWLAAINAHDVAALAGFMAPHFVFVDSLGNQETRLNPRVPGSNKPVYEILSRRKSALP